MKKRSLAVMAVLLATQTSGCTSGVDGDSRLDEGAAPTEPDRSDAGAGRSTPVDPGSAQATPGGPSSPSDDDDGAGPVPTTPKVGFFVAVGYGGLRARSTDGMTWTNGVFDKAQGGDDQDLLRDVAGADGTVIAAGWKLKHSSDATTWANDSTMGQWFGGLIHGKGLWVSAGGWGRRAWSANGIDWTFADDKRTSSYRSIAYGNVMGGRWVAVGDKGMRAFSSDGKTWTNLPDDITSGFSDVAYGNGVFVALGNGVVARSTDGGASWTTSGALGGATSVIYGASEFVAIGNGNAYHSTDGAAWTTTNGGGGGWQIAYGNGVYVTSGFFGDVRRSTDGKTWSNAPKLDLGKNGVQRVRYVTP